MGGQLPQLLVLKLRFKALDRDDSRRSGFELYIFALYIIELSDADTYTSRNLRTNPTRPCREGKNRPQRDLLG